MVNLGRTRKPFDFNKLINKKTEQIYKELEAIGKESEMVAQNVLAFGASMPDFTQKHQQELANYIALQPTAIKGEYRLVAGETANDEIRYELYYAEYGAGKDKQESPIYNPYVPTGNTRRGEYWWYPLLESRAYIKRNGEIAITKAGYTNTSVPLFYMENAKEYAKLRVQNLKIKTKKLIKTTIKRGISNVDE